MIAISRQPMGRIVGVTLVLLAAIALTDAMGKPVRAPIENAKPLAIAGVCQDEDGVPLGGVRVALYHEDRLEKKAKLVRAAMTADDGRFEFREMAVTDGQNSGYAVVANKAG